MRLTELRIAILMMLLVAGGQSRAWAQGSVSSPSAGDTIAVTGNQQYTFVKVTWSTSYPKGSVSIQDSTGKQLSIATMSTATTFNNPDGSYNYDLYRVPVRDSNGQVIAGTNLKFVASTGKNQLIMYDKYGNPVYQNVTVNTVVGNITMTYSP